MDFKFMMSQDPQMEMTFEQKLLWLIRGASATAGAFWAGLDAAMQILIILAMLDYVSGVFASYINKTIDSGIGKRGIAKKGLMFIVVCAVYVVQDRVPFEVPFSAGSAVCSFYIINEAISILENAAAGGIKLPPWLAGALARAGELKQTFNASTQAVSNGVNEVGNNDAGSK